MLFFLNIYKKNNILVFYRLSEKKCVIFSKYKTEVIINMYNNVKPRSLATCILLSFCTCGIYAIFWLYGLINDVCDLKGVARTGGKDILFSILTCGLYGIYVFYRMGCDLDSLKESRGLSSSKSGILFLVLTILGLGIVNYIIAQHTINELC